jgi:hemolysin III
MAAVLVPADDVRPRWRGVIHRWAAVSLAPVFAVLVWAAPDAPSASAVTIHGLGVVGMLAVSATYHSGRLSPATTQVFKRIDHATILLAIAGTYTAVTVLALDGADQARMLWIVGVGAAAGVAVRMAWLDAPYPLTAAVYLVVGWSALADLPAYAAGTTAVELALVVAGGLVYTAAGVVYALHRPVLAPATFGYHELFHALTVVGAACHVAAVALLLGSP